MKLRKCLAPAPHRAHEWTTPDTSETAWCGGLRNEPPLPRVVLAVDDPTDETRCHLCGEPADGEMGEFWVPSLNDGKGDSVLAHGQCGIDHGLELA